MNIKDNTIIFELYGKTFEFDKIPFALWKLSEAFELKIKEDAEKLHQNQKNGKVLNVTNDGYNAEGKEQTSYQVIPWAWDNIDAVEKYINNVGDFVSEVLSQYEISLTPNWNQISAPFIAKIKRIREILGEAQSNAFANAAQQMTQTYQKAYDEELSRDYGLSFGILSSSLTAHLVYAAQATAKEMKDRERAENFASSVAGNPMEKLLIAVFNAIHPLYLKTVEPAMLQILAEYYAYIVSLFANELGYNYEEIANQFNIDNSIAVLNTSPISKDTILNALCKNPSNGVVIGYAITNSLIDDELMNYAYNSGPMFTSRMNNWAISKLIEIYDAGKLFNKPLINDDNREIHELIIKFYDVDKSSFENEQYLNILTKTYGDSAGDVLIELYPHRAVSYLKKASLLCEKNEVDESELMKVISLAVDKQILDKDKPLIKNIINKKSKSGLTLLMYSAANECNQTTITEYLIALGSNINEVSDLGVTPLMFASVCLNDLIVELLINLGANINCKCNRNATALWRVSFRALPADKLSEGRKIAKMLLDKGADINVINEGGVALYNLDTDAEIEKMILQKYPQAKKGASVGKAAPAGCYVATCVYGSYDCPQVWTLRRFRDNTLADTLIGRAFIRTYYAISPTLVKWFGNTPWIKAIWKNVLDRMVAVLHVKGIKDTPYVDKNCK